MPSEYSGRLSDDDKRIIRAATLLGIAEVAERTGYTESTIRTYCSIDGEMPTPDQTIGRTRGWLPDTIDDWLRARNGGSARLAAAST